MKEDWHKTNALLAWGSMACEVPVPTVFVVDDDPALARLLRKTLEKEGYRVATAASGAEAIVWLRENWTDLMVLDLTLPDMEGRDLVNHLAATGRSVPFIIITGQGDVRAAVEMMKRGALDYLVKNLQFIGLVPEVVRHALSQAQQHARLAAAEESLRQSEARFRMMADHAPVLIWMSGMDKLCTWFNRPWLEFTGRALKEELGMGWSEGVHPDDRARCLQVYGKAFDERKPFAMEYRLRRHDGEWRWVYDQGIPLEEAGDAFAGYIGSCIDITERKRLEKEILEISEWERNRTGQDLHDGLCQHLAGIEFRLLGLKQKLEDKARKQAAEATELARLVREGIEQTRTLARGLSPVMLGPDGLMNALRELAMDSERVFNVSCSVNCPAPVTIHDNTVATHLYRIAREAVHNAIRHGRAKFIVISLLNEDDRLILGVKDDGIGFPKTPANPNGLGLRLMQYRAGLMGGSLAVQPDAEGGTSVVCLLNGARWRVAPPLRSSSGT